MLAAQPKSEKRTVLNSENLTGFSCALEIAPGEKPTFPANSNLPQAEGMGLSPSIMRNLNGGSVFQRKVCDFKDFRRSGHPWLSPVIAGCLASFCAHLLIVSSSFTKLALTGVPLVAMTMATAGVGKAASYCRFSSPNQTERTIADQQRDCGNRAARDGNQVLSRLEFVDEAVSGRKRTRVGFERMLEAARAGEFDVLYVVNLSRLARDHILTMQTLQELVYRYHIRVISIDEGIDTATTQGWELIAAIFSVLHEQFLKKLSQDVFRGQMGVVLDGFAVGDHCFGYDSDPVPGTEGKGKGRSKEPKRGYIIRWSEMQWVLSIFVWFVEERKSLRWIARELNRFGAPKDHRATTPEWDYRQLTSLLSNTKYVGLWPWGENKNVHDPISHTLHQEKRSSAETEKWIRILPELQVIDHETFQRAQKLLQQNAERVNKCRDKDGCLKGSTPEGRAAHPQHLLSAIVECGECARWISVTTDAIELEGVYVMVHQFVRWLRGQRTDADLSLNLLASELVVSGRDS